MNKHTYIISSLAAKVRFYIFSALSLSVMVLIFNFSSQTSDSSSIQSGQIIEILAKILYKNFDSLTNSDKSAIIAGYQFFIRKLAHFSIYAVLGIFVAGAVVNVRITKKCLYYLLPTAVCVIYSVSDEIHQTFVSGRACRLFDVFVDFCGASCGVAAVLLIFYIIHRSKMKKMLKN